MGQRVTFYLLITVALIGLLLRLYGLDWDQGYGLHPDERYITWVAASVRLPQKLADVLDPARTGLNPYMWPPDDAVHAQPNEPSAGDRSRPFSYGHWPLYLMVLVAGGDSDEARLALVGRVLSALFDTLTILLTFALGRFVHGRAAGLLAAVFLTPTVMHIQLAHFATFDAALTCCVVATLLFAARFVRHSRPRDAVVAGLCLGLAVGAKFSAVLLLVPVTMAHTLHWGHLSQRRHSVSWLLLCLLVALFAFGLTNPFSLIQPREFVDNLKDQSAMLRGDDNFVFTRQYYNTSPFVYPVEQQLRWGMGLPLGLIAFGGLACALVRAWRRSFPSMEWVLLSWAIVYLGFTGGLYVKFMRYMLPLSPVLMVYGAGMVQGCKGQVGEGKAATFSGWGRRLRVGLVVLIILPTSLYALAFLNVYRGDHPWLRLSRWIYTHIPSGATIAYEHWDHHLPLTVVQDSVMRWPGEYRQAALDVYAPDSPAKLDVFLERLAASDYLVIASNRLYGSTARWPERYPLMQRYYQRLFEGQMGYRLVALPDVERQPRLGPLALVADPFGAAGLFSPLSPERARPAPLTLSLGRADESFTVYDHPRPLLFQNVARLSSSELARLFTDLLERHDR